ncbi:MAG TPA: TrmH family RNA methyltransferase [Caulobacterales bacterium]|nr:TrmH family RNA methyltransferase [Caulobacterales bacterium]
MRALNLRLALYQPDMPPNLGAAIRVAACFAAPLEIIEPCGFLLTDPALKRVAMDYAGKAEIVRRASWAAFLAAPERAEGRLILFTTQAEHALDAFVFAPGDTLLFGRESAGAPPEVHEAAAARVRIPVRARSLNLAVSTGVALFEARRQLGWPAATD